MGMTIDKAIDRLEDLHFEQDNWEYGELTEDCFLNREALQLAVNTMRKYQKIEEIINAEVDPIICNNFGDVRKVQAIREVLEDGNE